MTEPGEWFLDRKAGVLYYMPKKGEQLETAEVIAPVTEQVLRLEGRPRGKRVEHVHFKGITFSHTEWWLPESFEDGFVKGDVGGFIQAAFGVPAAVFAEGARHCAFDLCRITNVGGYGIELGRGCQGNRISHCEVSDLGAGGIKIGEPLIRSRKDEHTHSNSVADSHIHHGGEIFHSGIGIWVGQSYDNRFAHNHLHDFYYSGFSVGWTWGYGPALAGGNIVEFNHVHHIGVRSDGDGPILSDMGGIYTLGTQHGSIIRNNVFHDIMGLRYGGWGIYNDEGSTGIVSENNLVYRTTHGGYHQHYGKKNVVRNNIFAFARDFQVQLSRAEEHLSFTFERNIVFWKNSQLVSGRFTTALFEMDHNLYWQQDRKTPTLGESTWKEWQARGKDPHSLFADPKFADPKSGDFRLLKGSPASKIGFKIFTWDKVGPRKRTR